MSHLTKLNQTKSNETKPTLVNSLKTKSIIIKLRLVFFLDTLYFPILFAMASCNQSKPWYEDNSHSNYLLLPNVTPILGNLLRLQLYIESTSMGKQQHCRFLSKFDKYSTKINIII